MWPNLTRAIQIYFPLAAHPTLNAECEQQVLHFVQSYLSTARHMVDDAIAHAILSEVTALMLRFDCSPTVRG